MNLGITTLIENHPSDDLRLHNEHGMFHCTGESAIEEIKREFKDKFVYNNTGNIIKIV